jgi:hypothetical protein
MRVILAALAVPLLLAAAPAPSHYVRPLSRDAELRLEEEGRSTLPSAQATVADMQRLAHTPDEQALARRDAAAVNLLRDLLTVRRTLRAQQDALDAARARSDQAGIVNSGAAIQQSEAIAKDLEDQLNTMLAEDSYGYLSHPGQRGGVSVPFATLHNRLVQLIGSLVPLHFSH